MSSGETLEEYIQKKAKATNVKAYDPLRTDEGREMLTDISELLNSRFDRYQKNYSEEEIRRLMFDRPIEIFLNLKKQCEILRGLKTKERTEIAFLPLGFYNAYAEKHEDGNVIVVDMYLKSVLYEFCMILVGVTYLKQENLLSGESFSPLFFSFCNAHAKFMSDDLPFPENDSNIESMFPIEIVEVAAVMSEAIYLFAVAHEYAHHLLGHTDKSNTSKMLLPNLGKEVQIFNRSQMQELEADRLAVDLFDICQDSSSNFILFNNISAYFYAPLLFFDILETLDSIASIKVSDGKHPEPAIRKYYILHDFPALAASAEEHVMYKFMKSVLDAIATNIS